MSATFALGTHQPQWLWDPRFKDVLLCVSNARLQDRVSPYPRANCPWVLDSGAFSELRLRGRWTITPEQYVAQVRRYADELGMPLWVAIMDFMCEPWIISGRRNVSRKSPKWAHGTRALRGIPEEGPDEPFDDAVLKHLRWTVDNYLALVKLAPDLPWMPVLQGWHLRHYLICYRLYRDAGVDLATLPIVGLGTVCGRDHTAEIAEIVWRFHDLGLKLHGFGVKSDGLAIFGDEIASADSLAWSAAARNGKICLPGHSMRHANCANCPDYALLWRRRVLTKLESTHLHPRQHAMTFDHVEDNST